MTARVTSLVVLVALTVLYALGRELSDHAGPAAWGMAALAAGAFLVGAWCAPLFAGRGVLPGTPFARWRPQWDRPKTIQVVAGAVAAAGLALLLDVHPSTAGIAGIAVAIAVGAVLPVPHDGTTAREHGAAAPRDQRDA